MRIHEQLRALVVAVAVPLCTLAHLHASTGSHPAGELSAKAAFEENKGQVRTTAGLPAPHVRYRLSQGATQLFLLESGIAYQFSRVHYPEGYAELMADARHDRKQQERLDALHAQVRLETFRMDMRLEGANTDARITTEGRSSDHTHYYNFDALDVHSFSKVTYHDAYPGIDWVVYTTEKGMKYDFVVRPGADPNAIRLRFEHHEELEVDAKGNLIHGNRMGRFTEERPVSFQDGKEIATRFLLEGNVLRFALEAYDRHRTLTIDPARVWGTYYGGTANDHGHSTATDAAGNVYVAGSAFSTSMIASGGHQNSPGGMEDAFLVKFNSAGQRQWASYYGGAGTDVGLGCATDGSGNVFLAGTTNSTSGIASGGHQNTMEGQTDAFLVKFDASGVRQWATYYGGDFVESGNACAVDAMGQVYLAGGTFSYTGIWQDPSPSEAVIQWWHGATVDGVAEGFDEDAFLAKFDANGTRQWGTYFGGVAFEGEDGYDRAHACAVDANGNVILAGSSFSSSWNGTFPTGGHQGDPAGQGDAFLLKLTPMGALDWATFYGGAGVDDGRSCSVDPNGNIFLAGTTVSTTSIASGGHQNALSGGGDDAYLVKFDDQGTRLWGTYYGGADLDEGNACATDADGNVYLTGQTRSSSGIASGGHQDTYAGSWDAFLVKFNGTGVRQWGTYYGDGGEFDDWGQACATQGSDFVYMAGQTGSPTGIASDGHQNTHGGSNWDAFLAKFESALPSELATGNISGSPFCAGAPVTVPYTATGPFEAGNIFTAQLSDATGGFSVPVDIGSLSATASGSIDATIPGGTASGTGYRIRVVSSDPEMEGDDNGADITIQTEGDDCDDGDPSTMNDTLDEECTCAGEPIVPLIDAYRYWFDDDVANAVTTTVVPVEVLLIEEAFLADGLEAGLRRVSVQARDNMGFWSSPQTSLFARVDGVVSGYRYWVNDDPSNAVNGTVTAAGVVDLSAALPVAAADRPFNLITIQFLDPAGIYSAPITKAFALTQGQVAGYRYWVNDDPSTVQTVSVTPTALLDLTDPLVIGTAERPYNHLTIQFRDASGIHSVPYTTTFVRSTGPIVEYQYWIDDVVADRVTVSIGPAEVVDLIDDLQTSAAPGTHLFSIRFRGESGSWSVPLSTEFLVEAPVYDCPDLEANIGDVCDPGPGFGNGLVNSDCECMGELIDCEGVVGGSALPGTSCDDEDPDTFGDTWLANCTCVGTLANDCEGVPGGPAQPGTACNDNNDCTVNDLFDANCNCAGTFADADNDGTCDANDLCPGGPEPGTACNDNDDCTTGDVIDTDCNCAGTFADADNDGTCDANDLCPGGAEPGTACNDNDDCTTGDVIGTDCNCEGTFADADNDGTCDANDLCPGGPEPGTLCDDGNTSTEGDVVGTDCLCAGTPTGPCTTDLDFVYQADGADDLDWQLFEQNTNILVQTGGGALIGNGSEATCLPDGCFYLVVTDGGGDGVVGGGYLLKINSSVRLIDNLYGTFGEGGFTSGGTSTIDNNEGFCLPVGTDRLIVTSCDKRDWKLSPCGGEFVVANANAAVSAQYNVNNANSGYQMWWYTPNGGYSFKRFQSHSTNNGLAASATRACHFMLNGWSGNQLAEGGFYNVKVRGRVNGVYNPWGPACRLVVNSAEAQCPRTKLMDLPGNQYLSCGQSRTIGANQYVHAKPVSRVTNTCTTQRANRYQFRFRIPAENVTIVKTAAVGSGNYFVNTMGLTCGKTYEVDVRVSFDGGSTWCHSSDPYGDVCLLTTTCSFGMAQEGGHTNGAGQSELRGTKQEGLLLYPNPNAGNELFVSLTGIDASTETVNVDIYDSFGKRVSARTIAAQDAFVNSVVDLNGLANGIYMVSIGAGSTVHTERLVIQR